MRATRRLLAAVQALLLSLPIMACTGAANLDRQRGLVLPTFERDGYATGPTDAALAEIAGVGAGWVQLVPTWYQATGASSTIAATDGGPSEDGIRGAIALAGQRGLKVLLKPHVDVSDGTDRARIRPDDPDAWFASYTEFVVRYAAMAAELGVAQFAVGTELSDLSGDRERWVAVIDAVRAVYGGELVYAANYYEAAQVAFWDRVDLVGIDAYYPLAREPTTDVATLEAAYAPVRAELADLAARTGRRILFTEAGCASQRGCTTAPYSDDVSEVPAQDEQAAAYRALLNTFGAEPWWAGVFWWEWTLLNIYGTGVGEGLEFSVRGKLAAAVLRERWT
ncbi:MAG: glycoside hydrolase family 113 [Pseudonocardia sp.]